MNRVIVYVNDIEDIRVFLNGELIGEISTALPTQKKDIITMIKKMAEILDFEYTILKCPYFINDFEESLKNDEWFASKTHIYQDDEEVYIKGFDPYQGMRRPRLMVNRSGCTLAYERQPPHKIFNNFLYLPIDKFLKI